MRILTLPCIVLSESVVHLVLENYPEFTEASIEKLIEFSSVL